MYKQFPDKGDTWTSGVWTEPIFMDKAYWEFKDDTTKCVLVEMRIWRGQLM